MKIPIAAFVDVLDEKTRRLRSRDAAPIPHAVRQCRNCGAPYGSQGATCAYCDHPLPGRG